MQNFDPQALVDRVEKAIKPAEDLVNQIEAIANTLAPILRIFAPFLPAPIGTAVEDIPLIIAKVEQLKTFVESDLPQVRTLLTTAGTGATETASLAASKVGSYGEASNPQPTQPIAPPGMEFVTIDGKMVLRPKSAVGT